MTIGGLKAPGEPLQNDASQDAEVAVAEDEAAVARARRTFLSLVRPNKHTEAPTPPYVLSLDEMVERGEDLGEAFAGEEPGYARVEADVDTDIFIATLTNDDATTARMIAYGRMIPAEVARVRRCSPVKVHRQLRRIGRKMAR